MKMHHENSDKYGEALIMKYEQEEEIIIDVKDIVKIYKEY
jgi:hypothetical protein